MVVKDKELLKRLRELLIERKEHLEGVGDNSSTNKNDTANNKNKAGSYGNKQLSLGAHPSAASLLIGIGESDNISNKNGYSTVFMLSFLTFFFQTIFLLISYFIFK